MKAVQGLGMKPTPLKIRSVTIGGREPAFILGPCVIESEKFVRRMAQKIAKICHAENVSFIFKASYDKANRTSVKSFRGIDARAGCEILASIGPRTENSRNDGRAFPIRGDNGGPIHRFAANPSLPLPPN